MALDVLARRHLKKDKSLPFFDDFNFTDSLCPSNDCVSPVTRNTVNKCFDADINFFEELCTDNLPGVRPDFMKECVNSDVSLGFLAKNHLKNDKTLNEWNFDDDLNLTDILSSDDRSTNSEASIDEIVPDIDLSFCIKTNTKKELSVDTSSPESVDSGVDELISIESISSLPERKSSESEDLFDKEKLISLKQSLLSRAISAKPKIGDARQAKLKQIRNELFKKQSQQPVIDCLQQKHSTECKSIDNSNECVITSSFLTIQD